MFRDDDFGLAEVRKIALDYPEAFEKVSWGRPVFCAPKIFVMFGGSVKGTTRGEYIQYPHSILVKVDESDREALAQDTGSSTPPTWARRAGSGWTSRRPRRSIGTRCASCRRVVPDGRAQEADPSARRSLTRPRIGHGSIGAMSFASPFPDVDIPTASVYEYLFGNIDEADADRVALVDAKSGNEISYREMVARIDAFAGALAGRGIAVGDVVGLLAPNSSAFAIAFHGILRAGATATTINVLFTAKDIVKQLTDSQAKMLITVSPLLPQAKEAAAAVGMSDDQLVVLDGPGTATDGIPTPPSFSMRARRPRR